MTLMQMLDLLGLSVVAAQTGWIVMLHRRLGALRTTLASAGEVVGQMDRAARLLDESSGGALATVKDKLGELDRKTAACRSAIQDMDACTVKAKDVAARLERALRSSPALRTYNRPAPMPREKAEPLGFDEHVRARAEAAIEVESETHDQLVQRILTAQMPIGQAVAGRGEA